MDWPSSAFNPLPRSLPRDLGATLRGHVRDDAKTGARYARRSLRGDATGADCAALGHTRGRGEHGGEPESIGFCRELGLNYVSCSPFRVPVARLAAAQVEL